MIKDDLNEIIRFYQNLTNDKKMIIFPLLDRLVFMDSQLKELQSEIEKNGAVQEYVNGRNQKGMKQSASVQAYSTMLKSYVMVCTKINKYMSELEDKPKNKLDAFIEEYDDSETEE